ncbi:internal protein [Murine hepatitis virus]|uniref:Protein I n=8 Tax=Murine coronavirus TaxID=694005 RepID=IORF_CVMA5|nr:internal protein [Murine hepatitis virus]YP_009924330.1 internal protein [Murine hepatitis virus]P69614.2 RecName: Full=Protein I; AltName: Full=Accessory protein N2; AltName: Full=N internal ORF protein; Short=IORF; AltName: Full=Protein in nucleocapsid ORF [Murine hepatitis virus strain A59]AAX23984.1 I protein [synthetic construct]ACN89684.1 internal protein [Murine coronavirus RA59/R13]ACN89706.1 internal protein [Murine coronavirus RA59/SJHM]ACN89752.1 internal protein [Murine coronav
MESSRRPLGLTKPSVDQIIKIEAEGISQSRLQLLNPTPGVWFPITPGFLALPSSKRERSFSLQKDKECLLPMESPLQSKRDIGIDTTAVLLKHLMGSRSNYCPDGIFTILAQGPMLEPVMETALKVSSGLQTAKRTPIPALILSKGTQAVMRLFLLGLRPARYCLRAFMLKALEGLHLLADLVRGHNPVGQIIALEAVPTSASLPLL